MRRCLELAQMATGRTAPNPMVGAVLVHNNIIIGEGYHEAYGEPHAEVNCLNSVSPENADLIKDSILYVSLEPCSHFGKTPPCSDLIIKKNIPLVVIGCSDSFEKVNGSGIEKLNKAGIRTETGILEKECRAMNKRFFTFHEKKRPYIILKWAETADGYIAVTGEESTKISNDVTDRLVHKWRAEETAIFVGTNTLLKDDPALTVRHWKGNNPVRIVIDNEAKAQASAKIFDGQALTIVMNKDRSEQNEELIYFKTKETESFTDSFVRCLIENDLQSVIIEGGAKILQSFFDSGIWDEARVISNAAMTAGEGTHSPIMKNAVFTQEERMFSDRIAFYKNDNNGFL